MPKQMKGYGNGGNEKGSKPPPNVTGSKATDAQANKALSYGKPMPKTYGAPSNAGSGSKK